MYNAERFRPRYDGKLGRPDAARRARLTSARVRGPARLVQRQPIDGSVSCALTQAASSSTATLPLPDGGPYRSTTAFVAGRCVTTRSCSMRTQTRPTTDGDVAALDRDIRNMHRRDDVAGAGNATHATVRLIHHPDGVRPDGQEPRSLAYLDAHRGGRVGRVEAQERVGRGHRDPHRAEARPGRRRHSRGAATDRRPGS